MLGVGKALEVGEATEEVLGVGEGTRVSEMLGVDERIRETLREIKGI